MLEQLIVSTCYTKVQQQLLGEGNRLTLNDALDLARTPRVAMLIQMKQLTLKCDSKWTATAVTQITHLSPITVMKRRRK